MPTNLDRSFPRPPSLPCHSKTLTRLCRNFTANTFRLYSIFRWIFNLLCKVRLVLYPLLFMTIQRLASYNSILWSMDAFKLLITVPVVPPAWPIFAWQAQLKNRKTAVMIFSWWRRLISTKPWHQRPSWGLEFFVRDGADWIIKSNASGIYNFFHAKSQDLLFNEEVFSIKLYWCKRRKST